MQTPSFKVALPGQPLPATEHLEANVFVMMRVQPLRITHEFHETVLDYVHSLLRERFLGGDYQDVHAIFIERMERFGGLANGIMSPDCISHDHIPVDFSVEGSSRTLFQMTAEMYMFDAYSHVLREQRGQVVTDFICQTITNNIRPLLAAPMYAIDWTVCNPQGNDPTLLQFVLEAYVPSMGQKHRFTVEANLANGEYTFITDARGRGALEKNKEWLPIFEF